MKEVCSAICPLDGRYKDIKKLFSNCFSEYAFIKERFNVEINWLKYLLELNELDFTFLTSEDKTNISKTIKKLSFNRSSLKRIKELEEVTKHDVKAIEYYVCECLDKINCAKVKSLVHIGCTSEDINNVAYALMIKKGLEVWVKTATNLIKEVNFLKERYSSIPMLGHTHGQPATPTTVGKEFKVYAYRLEESLKNILSIGVKAKFNGATGNYNALLVAFPKVNWEEKAQYFIEKFLKLRFNPYTTQIESHDYICHLLDGIRHFNNVVCDLNVDMWLYISMSYFKQEVVKGEVGSSTMPHKVNPIQFENSEANVEMSNAIAVSLSNKLPKSRLQRDLSDSSGLRNIGLVFGYSVQALSETVKGLKKCQINETKIKCDLEDNYEVLAEPIQTMLRKYGMPDAYDRLKILTRGRSITKEDIKEFILSLDFLSKEDKNILLNLTPQTYIGYAEKLAKETF